MRRLSVLFGGLCAVYLLLGFVACRFFSAHHERLESHVRGVRAALVQLLSDERLLESRRLAFSGDSARGGLTRADRILSDRDLNQLAFFYGDSDWRLRRETFLGAVRELREDLAQKNVELKDAFANLDKSRRALEAEERHLKHQMKGGNAEPSRVAKLSVARGRLDALKNSDEFQDCGRPSSLSKKQREQRQKHGEALLELTERSADDAVSALEASMKAKLTRLRKYEQSLTCVRSILRCFDVWPFDQMFNMPGGK